MSYSKIKGPVSWYLPNTKKAFAYSTVATSDLIKVLSRRYITTLDVYHAINYDDKAKGIVKHFIENGYGNYLLILIRVLNLEK